MQTGTSRELVAEINVTPMIDVLLVLVIVFILAAQLRAVLQVNVPPPAVADPRTAEPQVVLDLRADGSYAINGTAVRFAALPARLRVLYAGTGRQLLYVRAARGRLYKEVIAAVDVAKGAGVPVIGYMP